MAKFTSYYGRYVLGALENNAVVLSYLLRDLSFDSPRWDARPDRNQQDVMCMVRLRR